MIGLLFLVLIVALLWWAVSEGQKTEAKRKKINAAQYRSMANPGPPAQPPREPRDTNPPISEDEFSHYLGRTWGEIFAEITGGANLVDGKQTWELADTHKHDLDTMLRCCYAEIKSYEASNGRQGAAPYYFERAAILFRKAKLYEKEIQICELYLSLNHEPYFLEHSPRVLKIKGRLPKARSLLKKQRQSLLEKSPDQ